MSENLLVTMEKLMRKSAHVWEDMGKKSGSGRDFNIALNSRLFADEYWRKINEKENDRGHIYAREYIMNMMSQDKNWSYIPNYNPATDNPIRKSSYFDSTNYWDNTQAYVYDITHTFSNVTDLPPRRSN